MRNMRESRIFTCSMFRVKRACFAGLLIRSKAWWPLPPSKKKKKNQGHGSTRFGAENIVGNYHTRSFQLN